MSFLKKVFGIKRGGGKPPTTNERITELRDMEELLTKKQKHLESQIKDQLALAKKNGSTNKRQALAALKRKKRFEGLLQQVDGTLSTLETQRETLEQAKNNVAVLQAMKGAAITLKAAQQHMNVDQVG